ncbi:MAG: hypothetical protein VX278_18640 [Myxococcota bacterium]|nr:hypothetical protein [Myxococcota bacterium]
MADGAISGLKQNNSDDVTQNHLLWLRGLVSLRQCLWEIRLASNNSKYERIADQICVSLFLQTYRLG